MIDADVVILSNTATYQIWEMTQNAINTLNNSQKDFKFNILVVETNPDLNISYFDAEIVRPNESFGYNRFLNIGIEHFKDSNSLYIILANNDLIFHNNWLSAIIYGDFSWDSACPHNPGWPPHSELGNKNIEGFNIGKEFTGWCQVFKRESLNKLLPLDEDIKFWFSDNWLAWKMQQLEMKNVLVGRSHVTHLTSQSHHLIPDGLHQKWTHGQHEIFLKKIAQ